MRNERDNIEGVLGAVLAGGGSRRMGYDKALIEIEGRTLLQRAVETLKEVFEEVAVVAPVRQRYTELNLDVEPDLWPALGPLGGLHTALIRGAGRPVFLLACDMPFVTGDLVRWIVANRVAVGAGDSQPLKPAVRVARDRHGAQPLCGLYSSACLPFVKRALRDGRLSAQELLAELEAEILDLDPQAAWYDRRLLANINAPQDIRELSAALGSKS